ncbi:MAG: energy-coupling factor transporter ATPase [Clostridia bacterium]|nr:energy-coupling factor transporter ATPase [Clostridia bacterium]
MAFLEVKNINYSYSKGTPFEIAALKNCSFAVEKGEYVGVIGHTGSGKSTLMQMLNALQKPDSGAVLLDGKDINTDKVTARDTRFRVGLVFQYPEYQLFEETVRKDIAYGPTNMKLSPEEIEQRVLEAANIVGLPSDLLDKSPFDLSGGEKRRAAIAGVMAMKPEVLILDEPAAGLDPIGRKVIMDMINKYRASTGATVLLVSHSMETVAAVADRILVLNKGTIAMDGTVDSVFSRAKELIEMGLDVPAVTRIAVRLKEMGYDVNTGVYSVADAADMLLHLLGKKEGTA